MKTSRIAMVILLCVACPIFGLFSYHFCQLGNWLMTYLTSGISFILPLVAGNFMAKGE
jgi:hypothetical protein